MAGLFADLKAVQLLGEEAVHPGFCAQGGNGLLDGDKRGPSGGDDGWQWRTLKPVEVGRDSAGMIVEPSADGDWQLIERIGQVGRWKGGDCVLVNF